MDSFFFSTAKLKTTFSTVCVTHGQRHSFVLSKKGVVLSMILAMSNIVLRRVVLSGKNCTKSFK